VRNQHRALCQHNSKKNSRKYVKISKINKYIGVRYNLEIGIPDFLWRNIRDNRLDLDQRQLPTYIAAATDVNPDINVLAWWEIHEQEIPNWAKACKKILLIQSSSAALERVFSLLEIPFGTTKHVLWRTILKPPSCFSITKDDHIKGILTLYVVYIILHISISSDRILF